MGNNPSSSSSWGDGNGGHHSHNNHSSTSTFVSSSFSGQQQQQQQPHRRGDSLASAGSGIRHLLRNNGALGLSKAELDARCQPSGLYPSCNWEYKHIRRLIGDGKLAARCKGTEHPVTDVDTECPICFFYYSAINQTKCCHAYICTECYLQVRQPKDSAAACCPYCNQKLSIKVANISAEAARQRQLEEQRIVEAREKAQKEQQQAHSTAATTITTENRNGSNLPSLSATPKNTAFGASLEQNSRVAMLRKRSTSMSGSSDNNDNDSNNTNREIMMDRIKSIAMTPEERHALEAEMKAQHHHPLAQRIQQEEDLRRWQNQVEYLNSPEFLARQERQARQEARLQELRAQRRRLVQQQEQAPRTRSSSRNSGGNHRDWNRIVQAFESSSASLGRRRPNGNATFDDLVFLEAAIMLSNMEDAAEAAADPDDTDSSEFAHPARAAGFSSHGGDAAASAASRGNITNPPETLLSGSGGGSRSSLSSTTSSSSSSRLLRTAARGGAAAASWMMAALLSEEEQLAMAIANSLQDVAQQQSQPPPPNNNNYDDDDSDDNANANSNQENPNDHGRESSPVTAAAPAEDTVKGNDDKDHIANVAATAAAPPLSPNETKGVAKADNSDEDDDGHSNKGGDDDEDSKKPAPVAASGNSSMEAFASVQTTASSNTVTIHVFGPTTSAQTPCGIDEATTTTLGGTAASEKVVTTGDGGYGGRTQAGSSNDDDDDDDVRSRSNSCRTSTTQG